MEAELGHINSARDAFWSKKSDSDIVFSSQNESSNSQFNECKDESQLRTLTLSETGIPSPVLNIIDAAKKEESKVVTAKKCLILVQDQHYEFNQSVSKMWSNFLLQKAQHRLSSSEIVSEDDFVIVSYDDLNSKLNDIKRNMRDGEIQSIIVFDDQCHNKPENLGGLLLNEKHQIRLKDLVENQTEAPLTICIMTPWSANATLRQLHELSLNFNEAMKHSSTNFLYPVAKYQSNDNFCFEMATLFRFLVNQLSNFSGQEKIIQASQLNLYERLRGLDFRENEKICAMSSSSFLFFPSCDFERQNLPNLVLGDPNQEVLSSRIEKLDEIIQKTRKAGRIKSSESGIEKISMDLSGSAIALLNDNEYLKSKFTKQLFALSLAVLHSCCMKTDKKDRLSDDQIKQLWKEYSSKDDIPFSNLVWRASPKGPMAPRNMMKAIRKALYGHETPEWEISDRAIRVIDEEYSFFDSPFAEFTEKLEKIRTILPTSDDYTEIMEPGGVSIYCSIFLTPRGFEALDDMARLHAVEAQYKSGTEILGVWQQSRKNMFYEGGEPTYISWSTMRQRLAKLCEIGDDILMNEKYPYDPLDQRRDDEMAMSGWVEMAKSMWGLME